MPANGRARRSYSDQVAPRREFVGHDPDTPVVGFYRHRLRSGGVYVGIEVRYGAPLDPVTGEEMDRSWRFYALANGQLIDLDRVWPACAGNSISEAEARHFANMQQWGEANGDAALADPTRKVDWLQNALPF